MVNASSLALCESYPFPRQRLDRPQPHHELLASSATRPRHSGQRGGLRRRRAELCGILQMVFGECTFFYYYFVSNAVCWWAWTRQRTYPVPCPKLRAIPCPRLPSSSSPSPPCFVAPRAETPWSAT